MKFCFHLEEFDDMVHPSSAKSSAIPSKTDLGSVLSLVLSNGNSS